MSSLGRMPTVVTLFDCIPSTPQDGCGKGWYVKIKKTNIRVKFIVSGLSGTNPDSPDTI